jgi:hypothetical protein
MDMDMGLSHSIGTVIPTFLTAASGCTTWTFDLGYWAEKGRQDGPRVQN